MDGGGGGATVDMKSREAWEVPRRRAIPPIDELRQRIRKSETEYGRIPWISKAVIYPFVSVYLSSVFLRCGLSGNQVTLLMTTTAVLGAALFFEGSALGYGCAGALMLLAWVLDHSDGEVLRFRGESSAFGIYLDRFTHRVTYPLMHLGLGMSLYRASGDARYLAFGAAVAYFYQLGVAHGLDKLLISLERGGVDLHPLGTIWRRLETRHYRLGVLAKVAVGVYSRAMEHAAFAAMVIVAAALGIVARFYVVYGCALIANWVLESAADFCVGLSRTGELQQQSGNSGSRSTAAPASVSGCR